MLTMDQQQCIRMMRQWLDFDLSEIEELTGLNFRTVKKYADGPVPQPVSREKNRPVIGPYEETIDVWMEEDLSEPAKQRRNAQDMYEELRDEWGYEGSARTVRRYVREAKPRIVEARNSQFLELEHPPAEGQVDFGDVWIIEPEKDRRSVRKLLLVTFPYSTARFGVILPAENRECLLWGLGQLFQQMGGVPPKLVFDNLSPVVSLIRGERSRTEEFQRFQMHYRFQVEFCNPNSGHEKGSVEAGIRTVRHWHLTPPPVVNEGDLKPVNEELARGLREDRSRPHYDKDESVAELFEEEQSRLLRCPREPLETCRVKSRMVNKVGTVQVDGEDYHLPWCSPGQKVVVKLFWDRLEVLDNQQNKLGSVPRQYVHRAEEIDWAATLKLVQHKPGALEQATIVKRLPKPLREFLLQASEKKRPERVRTLVALFESGYSLREVKKAVQRGQKLGQQKESGLRMIAGLNRDSSDEERPKAPESVRNWRPDLELYDGLLEGGVGDE